MNYLNKCVWITGGGSGIGAALAHAYWRKGAKVAISGRRLEKLHATIAEYEISAEQALAIECDVRDAANVERAVETILSLGGALILLSPTRAMRSLVSSKALRLNNGKVNLIPMS